MPPKKKKTQLKPVVRGFATTSQPKKTVQDVALNSSQIPSDVDPEGSKDHAPELAQPAPSTPSFDPDSVKNQSLQNLVDKLQEKTEKEITRYIKVVETEKRFAQTFPRLDFDSILIDRILKITLSEGIKVPKAIDEAEDKIIARLGITYGVLRRLGFTEVIVENCLKNISSIELEDALDWLYLHCSEPELQTNNLERAYPNALKLREYAGVSLRQHSTPPVTPLLQSESSSRKRSPELRSTILPAIDPNLRTVRPNLMSSKQVDNCDINFDILALDDCSLDLESPSPTTAFVRAKLLHDFARAKSLSSDSEEQLRGQMVALSSDYLFDEREAQELYAREKERLDHKLLQERLLSPPSGIKTTNAAKSTPSPYFTDSQQDSDSDESSTGMLGILDNPDASEVTVKGITLNLRRMDLPKHWSGPTPKTLLRDFVIKQDRYAAISYSTLSKHSRARRASVIISWQNKIRDEWTMDDVACPDDNQAENFVATIALHSLMYPISEGFASPTPVSSITSFRLLPAVYRGLWDELETSRRINEDITNRKVWAKLQSILEGKTQVKKASERQTKQLIEKGLSALLQPTIDTTGDFGALVTAFQVRQASQAYGSILTQRNRLPIARYRDDIIKLLDVSQVLVLSGETGCGKSTQVPSFILEHHLSVGKPCKVICTEPRRISAISLAHRVSYELCDPPQGPNSLVGYSIRLESNISRITRLAFVTNGIALRMLESGQGSQGTGLDDVTHIIVDEVHERSIESDFLLIVLKELLAERSDLKVILMSATLDAEKISGYFDNCPTLHVPGRAFPVTVQHLEDAIEYTRWSITETSPYAHRWSDKFSKGKNRPDWTEDRATLDDDDDDVPSTSQGTDLKLEKRYSPETIATLNIIDERLIPYDLIVRLLEKICFEDQHYKPFSAAVLIFMPGLGEIRRLNDLLIEHPLLGSGDFNIYPLHSTLSNESQGAAFDIPPPGVRKIVIATNIAETGITIPDITCVIDSGKHREMRFDEKRQISRLVETFIAKSNAAQRRGRAGRVQHGLCFHLFTKLRYETQMVENPIPEMLRLSLSDLALKIKILNVKLGTSIGEVLSRALDPPTAINVQRAVSMLVEARALTTTEDITPMGRLLSKLPTDVHLGKFLLIATVFRCLDPALTIAATLNSKSPFVVPMGLENDADRAKASFCTDNSDFLTIHNAFSSWRRACANPAFVGKFCRANFLSHKNLQQIEELRQQFLGFLIDSSFIQAEKSLLKELSRARYARNKTRFVSVPAELDINSNNPILIHAAITAGLYPKILSINSKNRELRTITNNQFVSFHPTSVNFGKNPAEFGVNHLVYFTIMHSKKLYAWETGPVDDLALVLLCGDSEHKLLADTVSIDRKLRFQVPPRVNLALKILREQLGNLLAQQYQGKVLSELHNFWKEIGLLAMGHVKVDPDENETTSVA